MAKFLGGCLLGFLIGGFATYRVMQYALLSSYAPILQSVIHEITLAQKQGSVDALVQSTIDQQKVALDALILEKKAELDATIKTILSRYLQQKIHETLGGGRQSSPQSSQ